MTLHRRTAAEDVPAEMEQRLLVQNASSRWASSPRATERLSWQPSGTGR